MSDASSIDVLLIEDEVDISSLYKEFLEGAGYKVEAALDGQAGLELVSSSKPKLILLDIMMPKLDGIGVLRTLKDSGFKLPPTIMLTNLADEAALKEAAELGAVDNVIKGDITPEDLLNVVKKYLKN